LASITKKGEIEREIGSNLFKPIKSPRKGSKERSKRKPKAALVWRTGLSGEPPDSVRCTRENHSELLTFGFLENVLRYNSLDCPV
jgi:hypothetical protein